MEIVSGIFAKNFKKMCESRSHKITVRERLSVVDSTRGPKQPPIEYVISLFFVLDYVKRITKVEIAGV